MKTILLLLLSSLAIAADQPDTIGLGPVPILASSITLAGDVTGVGSANTVAGIAGATSPIITSSTIATSNATTSTSVSTGAIVDAGGLGVAGTSWFGGNVTDNGNHTVTGELKINNNFAAYDSTETNSIIYGTNGSGGSYPFTEAGNLIISPRLTNSSNQRDVIIATGNSTVAALIVDRSANVRIGVAALATTATNGFLYIPSCAGVPTGAPTAITGLCALVYDTTDGKMYVYNGGWQSALF